MRLFLDNVTIVADYRRLLRLTHEAWTNILCEEKFVWLCYDYYSYTPSADQLRLDYCLKSCLYIHTLVEILAEHEGDELRVGERAFVRVPLWEQFLGQLLVIGDKAIVEDGHSLLLIEYWVGLCVTHGVLTRGIPGMKNSDTAS